MRAYFSPEVPGSYHTLPSELHEDIRHITSATHTLPDVNAPTIAILSSIDSGTENQISLNWTLGNGSHQDLVSHVAGDQTGQLVLYHDLPLQPSGILQVGALACLGWHEGRPEVVVAGGHYESRQDLERQRPTPLNEHSLRLFGQIVLASAKTFTDLAQNRSCTLTLELKHRRIHRFPAEAGTLTVTDDD